MSEDLVIIFAYHFPPENVIGALRPLRFYKYLSRLGYRCHVLTAADVRQVPELDAEYVPDPFVVTPRQGMGWQAERALRRFVLPGVAGTQWALNACRAASRFLKANPHERVSVFSTFPPVGSHFAGYWFSRRHQLPWIADYRDPLADNPVYNHIPAYTKEMYRRVERLMVRSASFTIANTDAAQTKLKASYPRRADRIDLIWNGFDPEDKLAALPPYTTERKVLAHVGELYGGRNASPLLHSVRRLIDSGRLDPQRVLLHLAGPVVENSIPDAAFVSQALAEGWLRLDRERVPQKQAQRITQTVQTLLIIQPQTALQVPGKLFEYLQIGRPILCFIPRDSPVERILEKSGVPYSCIYPDFTSDAMDRAVLEFFQLPDTATRPSEWFESNFNARSQSEHVARLIEAASNARVAPAVLSEV